jgi:hypothetical protein
MNEQVIRYPNGRIMGRLIEFPQRIEARNPNGILIGWYCKGANQTRCASGQLFALGNAVRSLL